jgi:hypothetical protein
LKEHEKREEEKGISRQKVILKVIQGTKVCRLISLLKKAIKTVTKLPLNRVSLKAKSAQVRKINVPLRKSLAKSKEARKEKERTWG